LIFTISHCPLGPLPNAVQSRVLLFTSQTNLLSGQKLPSTALPLESPVLKETTIQTRAHTVLGQSNDNFTPPIDMIWKRSRPLGDSTSEVSSSRSKNVSNTSTATKQTKKAVGDPEKGHSDSVSQMSTRSGDQTHRKLKSRHIQLIGMQKRFTTFVLSVSIHVSFSSKYKQVGTTSKRVPLPSPGEQFRQAHHLMARDFPGD
jgi:hypothetical protein